MLFEPLQKVLYQLDNKGEIRVWKIEQLKNTILITHGLLNGAQQTQIETINSGKSTRSLQQQIESRINSRINKQILKGYKESTQEAKEGRSNALGFIKPMLAQPLQKVKAFDKDNTLVQAKYDGNRCLITNCGGKLIAYSRNGKIIDTIDHILKGIDIPLGATIDGELYTHGHSLQTIVSWIKRKQANTYLLRFHAYDLFSPLKFSERFERLSSFTLGDSVDVVPTWHYREMKGLTEKFNEVREEGYEGLILRVDGLGYEDGKRSKSLIKVKEFEDDEFSVVDIEIHESSKRCVLVCQAHNGKYFKVSPPGSLVDRERIYYERDLFIGKQVRVEYSTLTAEGIPFHAVATMWRNKGDE